MPPRILLVGLISTIAAGAFLIGAGPNGGNKTTCAVLDAHPALATFRQGDQLGPNFRDALRHAGAVRFPAEPTNVLADGSETFIVKTRVPRTWLEEKVSIVHADDLLELIVDAKGKVASVACRRALTGP